MGCSSARRVTIAPDAFGGIVAVVPFVDALTTILDPSMPLTVTEWEEWGDPVADPAVYAYMKAYSPYENVTDREFPPLLVLGSLNDTRVSYAEPTKWVARIRERSPKTSVLLKTEMGAGTRRPERPLQLLARGSVHLGLDPRSGRPRLTRVFHDPPRWTISSHCGDRNRPPQWIMRGTRGHAARRVRRRDDP